MRHILHIDMDAFFAAVEQRDHAALRGKPVLVGGVHRGVVAACSYEARAFGIHSAMPMVEALRRCPHAVVVPVRHAHYAAVSRQVFAIFAHFTPLIQGLSLDEAFLDVTGSCTLFGSAPAMAAQIKRTVTQKLGLTASAGVASCKFVAKIASDLRKPDGLVVVPHAETRAFLAPLPIERMWGVGPVTAQKLRRLGYTSLGHLASADDAKLQRLLGATGPGLAALARGDDPRPVVVDEPARSISAEATFDVNITDPEALRRHLLAQALRVAARMGAAGVYGRVITVKLKDSDFRVQTRQLALSAPIADPDSIFAGAKTLLGRFELQGRAIRLCGVGVSGLQVGPPAPMLFADPAAERRNRLEALRQQVARKYGDGSLTRATLLGRDPEPGD